MIGPINNHKTILREQARERLNGVTSQQREAASLQICARLRQQVVWKFTVASVISAFA